jgi:archaellum component FlaC
MNPVHPLPELFERLRAEVREARVAAILDEARAWAERQPASAVGPLARPPGFPASWPMSFTLNDVVRWHDADFVHACYEAILRRPADPAGFATYLNVVRAGRGKIEIAVGFARSEEGRRAGARIVGIDAAIWTLRLARVPVLGYVVRLAKWIVMGPRYLRERQAIEAYLTAQVTIHASKAAEDVRRLRLEMAYLQEREARNLGARLARLADQSQAVLNRLPAVEAALAQATANAKADLAAATEELRAGVADARGGAREALARADAHLARLAALETQLGNLRIEFLGELHDAHATRESGVAEAARTAASLEGRLTEVVTREAELLERRVAQRLEAVAGIERDVEALRAALATFRKDAS